MSKRMFDRSATMIGERMTPAYKIVCSNCGAEDRVTANNASGTMPPEGITQRFRTRGWDISKNGRGDLCPKCVAAAKEKKMKVIEIAIEKKEDNVVQMNITKVEPPREMSRDDRRIVFSRLNEVYVDEKTGYDNGWSDHRVAKDLGVPQAWVKTIREENFGVEAGNSETDAILDEVKAIIDKARGAVSEIREEAAELARKADAIAVNISADISRIEKKVADILSALGK